MPRGDTSVTRVAQEHSHPSWSSLIQEELSNSLPEMRRERFFQSHPPQNINNGLKIEARKIRSGGGGKEKTQHTFYACYIILVRSPRRG